MTSGRYFFLSLAILVLVFGGCNRKKSAPSTLSTIKPQITWATKELPEPRDWTDCATLRCERYALLVSRGLFRFEPASPTPLQPDLIKSFSVHSDGTLLLELPEKLRWSDGKEFEVKEILETFRRLLKRAKTPALFTIRNAREFSKGKVAFSKVGLKEISPKKLSIQLEGPAQDFLFALTRPALWPSRQSAEITLGRYRLLQNGHDVQHYVSASESDPDLILHKISDSHTRVDRYDHAEVDLVDDLEWNDWDLVAKTRGATRVPTGKIYGLKFPTAQRSYQPESVRRELVGLIDREEISQWVRSLPLETAEGLIKLPVLSELLAMWPKPKGGLFRKLRGANEGTSLFQNGWPNHIPKPVLAYESNPVFAEIAANLQAQWAKQAGVRTEIIEGSSVDSAFRLEDLTRDTPFSKRLYSERQSAEDFSFIPLSLSCRPILLRPGKAIPAVLRSPLW